jgi:hypothetical protein
MPPPVHPAVAAAAASPCLGVVVGLPVCPASAALAPGGAPSPPANPPPAGALLLVLCVTMAGSVLSASYALFLVRERSSRSKAVQRIAGASPGAFWAANAAWDGLQFAVSPRGLRQLPLPLAPAAAFGACRLLLPYTTTHLPPCLTQVTALGMLAVFRAFDLPQFRGPRLGAAAALLAAFGAGSLPMTYALQFGFEVSPPSILLRWVAAACLPGWLAGCLPAYPRSWRGATGGAVPASGVLPPARRACIALSDLLGGGGCLLPARRTRCAPCSA